MGVSQGCLLSPIINYLIQYIHFRSSYLMTYLCVKFKENPCVGTFVTPPFTEKWKHQSKFQNSVILSKFRVKFSKVHQVIYSSAPTSIPNIKALAQILFEISCTQDFQILFSKGHNSEKGNNSDMKQNMGQLFFHEECA